MTLISRTCGKSSQQDDETRERLQVLQDRGWEAFRNERDARYHGRSAEEEAKAREGQGGVGFPVRSAAGSANVSLTVVGIILGIIVGLIIGMTLVPLWMGIAFGTTVGVTLTLALQRQRRG